MKRAGLVAIVTAAAACGPAPNLLPVNDLNRPTDVAFMCFGAFPAGSGTDAGVPDGGATTLQISGRPMQACHPQNSYDPGATTTTRTFAFMPNSAAGTLSAVDADHWKLIDLNLDTGGFGTAPLGQLPSQISTSDDGCRLISANRGSCDLTLVDPSVLVAPTFDRENGNTVTVPSPRTASVTFRPIKGDGTPLLASPYEAVFLPQDTAGLLTAPTTDSLPILPTQNHVCGDSPSTVVGWPAQPGQPGPKDWYALVTYPSCDLIAVVALSSQTIVSSAFVRPTTDGQGKKNGVTLVPAGPSPSCPIVDCAGQALPTSAGVTADAATGADGAVTIHAPPGEAGVSDAALSTDAAGGAPGTGGSTGGAPGTGGSAGSTSTGTAGASGGAPGGATLGNQFPLGPYFGAGPLAPSGIAIVPDGSRAYVSLSNASFVVSVALSHSSLTLPGKGIALNEGARGSSRIRLNVDPMRYGSSSGVAGVFVGAEASLKDEPSQPTPSTAASKNFVGLDPARKYLYAIARDGTLRVIHVDIPGAETECETNADPLHLAPGVSALSACIPVDPAHRRPFSVGPGIHFPSLPVDVAAVDLQRTGDTSEQSVNGAHAWVLTDSGIVYLVNINPVLRDYTAVIETSTNPPMFNSVGPTSVNPPPPTEPPPFVNTLRDRNEISYSLTSDPSSGPPRVDVLPSLPATGPYLEQFWTQGSILNATVLSSSYVQTVAFFPQEPANSFNKYDPIDRRAVTAQTWSVTWEGPLAGVRNTGKMFSLGQLGTFPGRDPGGQSTDALIQDGGVNYCALGVVPGDLVTLTGCTDNSQCGLGEECVLGDAVSSAAAGLSVTGICVDPNRESAQASSCAPYLNSLRRYEVAAASPNNLIIRPRLDEVVFSALGPTCHPDIPATATTKELTDSCPDTLDDPTTAKFRCVSSYPGVVTTPRCLMPCQLNSDCRSGRLCVNFKSAYVVPQFCDHVPSDAGTGGSSGSADDTNCACTGPDCFCSDAPPFDEIGKSCFDQLVNYQVNAGKTFLVAGSQSGLVTTATLPPSGTCAANPTPDARFSFRIPMNAPTCTNVDASIAKIDSRLNPDAFSANMTTMAAVASRSDQLVGVVTSTPAPSDPCLYWGGPVTADPVNAQPTLVALNPDGTPTYKHVRALFQNSQLSFVLANLDRAPTTQFVTTFDVHGGFAPQAVQDPTTLEVSMPARIVLGPVDSIAQLTTGAMTPGFEAPYLFVVDQRRLGREQGGGPTHGQLLRINPFGYASTVGTVVGYQPIFEDYNASGGLFPIQ
jgi:hypothetical protein